MLFFGPKTKGIITEVFTFLRKSYFLDFVPDHTYRNHSLRNVIKMAACWDGNRSSNLRIALQDEKQAYTDLDNVLAINVNGSALTLLRNQLLVRQTSENRVTYRFGGDLPSYFALLFMVVHSQIFMSQYFWMSTIPTIDYLKESELTH